MEEWKEELKEELKEEKSDERWEVGKKKVVESKKPPFIFCRIVEIEGHCRWRK